MDLNLAGTNGQSFDEVLEKIKQGMKAARGGGWIDSDSGSELEIALDPALAAQPGRSRPTTTSRAGPPTNPEPSPGTEHAPRTHPDLDPPDGQASPIRRPTVGPATELTRLHQPGPGSASASPSAAVSHPQPPLNLPTALTPHDHHLHHSPLFGTPTTPYAPRTPLTPATSSGSPYVRHHFKFEYLPTADPTRRASAPQPRFIEASSPPPPGSAQDWPPACLPLAQDQLLCLGQGPPPDSPIYPRQSFEPRRIQNLNIPSPSVASPTATQRPISYAPPPSRWHASADKPFPALYTRLPGPLDGSQPSPGFEFPPRGPPSGSAPGQRPNPGSHSLLDPSSVSSVSFSLAPAAPIRLTAPEADAQSKAGRPGPIGRDAGPESTTVGGSLSALKTTSLEERDKDAIRARLLAGSGSGGDAGGARGAQFGAAGPLPGMFQQMRLGGTSPCGVAGRTGGGGMVSAVGAAPVRGPGPGHGYGMPIFYSSQPGGFGGGSGASSATSERSPVAHLTPKTPLTPIGFAFPSSSSSHGHSPGTPGKQPFVPVIVPVVPGIGGGASTPLPGQVQPEEVRKSVKAQPPVVNTGNSGAMIPQPGDWMCMCGFVNWRRRKVCMRCFPFADGNDSVGAMMAINAQRAALLAAGAPIPADYASASGGSLLTSAPESVFGPTGHPGGGEPSRGTGDAQAALGQIFRPPVGQQGQQAISPFDKAAPITPIGNGRFPGAGKARARLVVPGDEGEGDGGEGPEWGEGEGGKGGGRRRSFSMGAKAVWGPCEQGAGATGGSLELQQPERRIGTERSGQSSGSERALHRISCSSNTTTPSGAEHGPSSSLSFSNTNLSNTQNTNTNLPSRTAIGESTTGTNCKNPTISNLNNHGRNAGSGNSSSSTTTLLGSGQKTSTNSTSCNKLTGGIPTTTSSSNNVNTKTNSTSNNHTSNRNTATTTANREVDNTNGNHYDGSSGITNTNSVGGVVQNHIGTNTNTDTNGNSTRHRTATSPESSWQAIKALWQ